MTKPPRTNIDKELEELFNEEFLQPEMVIKTKEPFFWKFNPQFKKDTKKAIKQTLLTYIKELVGEEEPEYRGADSQVFARNQLRQEILRKAEEELND